MKEYPKDYQTLGFHCDDSQLHVVGLTQKKDELLLETYELLSSPEETKRIDLQEKLTVFPIAAKDILTRQLTIKLTKEKDLEEALPFQAEPLLPYPLAEALLNKLTLKTSETETSLVLLATKKDQAKATLEKANKWSVDPEVLTAEPAALTAFQNALLPQLSSTIIIHTTTESTSLVLIKEGKLVSSHAINQSLDNLSQWLAETKRILLSFKAEKTPILLTGQIVKTASYNEVKQKLALTEPSLTLPKTWKIEEDAVRFSALAFGCALNCLNLSETSVNFRYDEFSYTYPFKRFTEALSLYFILCVSLAAVFYFYGNSYLDYRLTRSKKEFIELLTNLKKPYKTFEKEYREKFPDSVERDSVEHLSREDLLGRIEYLDRQLTQQPESFSLYPNVPLVSDVLAWLTDHPQMSYQPDETGDCLALKIENFNYTMVKRPDQTKKNEPYQIKIDLEFTAPNTTMAREFRDALISPNNMVDPKTEVKWSSDGDKYRATFFLKNRPIILQEKKNAP